MFNNVLQNIGSQLEQNVLRSMEGTGYNTVRFLNLKSGEDRLQPNAVNIVLFGTTAERSIMGSPTFSTPTSNNMGIEQKPPLKLSVDILFIFNFSNYEVALAIYSQVLGYFYNNDLMNVPFDGYPNEVQILLSSFNDRDEIELWNSFGISGTPILRYDLKYVMISGKTRELPIIRTVSIDGGVINPEDAGISSLVLNMIYYPIDVILKGITEKTNSFCSIQLTGDEVKDNAEIKLRYAEVTNSYVIADTEILRVKAELTLMISKERDPAYPKLYTQFNPFFPSIDGLLKILLKDRQELENQGSDPSTQNYAQLCALAQSFTKDPGSLTQNFLRQLSTTSTYLVITSTIDDQIVRFDVIGASTYGTDGETNGSRASEQLSLVQLRVKWWELEDALKTLSRIYTEEEANPLLQIDGQAYIEFKNLLLECQIQLNTPIDTFSKLNNTYNHGTGDGITSAVRTAYFEAYQNASTAVNFLKEVAIPIRLEESLQRIFESQNNKQNNN
jgi:hypothetical protein